MNVLDFVMVGSDDHQKSGDFYDAVFEPLKLKRVLKTEKYLGYAHSSNPDKVQFYVTLFCLMIYALYISIGLISKYNSRDLVFYNIQTIYFQIIFCFGLIMSFYF